LEVILPHKLHQLKIAFSVHRDEVTPIQLYLVYAALLGTNLVRFNPAARSRGGRIDPGTTATGTYQHGKA
jgi:hypothetical protein